MNQKILFIIICIFVSVINAQEKNLKQEELKNRMLSEISRIDGIAAVDFRDLSDPANSVATNDTLDFHAASTMKTPVMIELFRQRNEGKFSLDDSVTVKNEFKSIVDGSPFILEAGRDGGEGLYKYLGQKMPIRFLIHEMITVSSNLATNILIEMAGPENVQRTIRALGTKKMKVLRGVEDNKAFEKGLNNSVTASDLGLLFEKIAREGMLDSVSCREMTDILLDQKFNDIIPAKLPKDVKVAHKTGSITGVRHDSGFVILPDGRKYVLVLLSKNIKDEEKAVEALSNISKIIYDYMINKI